jgi:tRNA A37 threonylcarbamoyladenosine modification protein TsaB
LIEILDIFLQENNIVYNDLENIVVVAGPGSFTGIRTIVLMVNTINFVINKNITSLNFFDLFNNYPIVKSSSKRDSFFQKDKDSQIEIINNDDLIKYLQENNIKQVY